MNENLPGYVLNALDEPERLAVEAMLSRDPESQAQVEMLRLAVAPLAADAEGPELPPYLVLNTLALVAEHACVHLPTAPQQRLYQGEAIPRRWFRRPDLLVAAAALIVVSGLCLPALIKSWKDYHVQSCKNNLHRFGNSLQVYGDLHEGRYPQVQAVDGPRGIAGMFVPALLEAGTLDPKVNVVCPADGYQRPYDYTIADLENMHRTRSGDFERVARTLAPGYAYSLGYEEGNELIGPRREMGDNVPLLADSPNATGSGNSPNHGGGGQNVLFTGGHVRWLADRTFGDEKDDIYLNQHNRVLAGVKRFDAVLGASNATPVPRPR